MRFFPMPLFTFFAWFFLVWASGWFALPFALRLWGHALPDGGIAVGRIAFGIVWTMLAFWLGRAGVPVAASAWLYVPLAVYGLWNWRQQRFELKTQLRTQRHAIWSVEAVFLSVFLIFFALRGYWSDTNGNNGEKSMDSALIGTLVRAQKLPPENPYSAGSRLSSYYIFGHLQTALLTRASATTGRWSYNLMCATLPALCFSALFSLGAGLTRRLDGGAFVSGTILGLGTLQPLYQWLKPDGLSPLALLRGDPSPIRNLDFFAVSRPLPNAINEFPWFTFNQAYLHAHYFDFPIQLPIMALAWAIFRAPSERRRHILLGVGALFSGAQILTNTWDFPAYALLLGLAFLLSPHEVRGDSTPKLRRVVLFGVVMLGAVLLASPYLLGINTTARGPSPLPQPASPLREWLLLWGPIGAAWMAFCAWATFRFDVRWRWALGAVALVVVVAAVRWQAQWGYPAGLDAQPQPTPEAVNEWFGTWNPARLVLPLIVFLAFVSAVSAYFNRGVTRFLPCLALAGLFAVLWSETTWAGFLGDPKYQAFADYKRQDTVFKFGLQAWFLWGTAASAGAYLTLRRWPLALRVAFVPFLLIMAVSSYVDTLGRTRGPDPQTGQTWEAFDSQKRQNWDAWGHMTSAERAAAAWLQDHTLPDENIMEAEDEKGGDYSIYTRYAHATGIATIIGPQAHSFQWSPNPIRLSRNAGEDSQTFLDRKAGAQWENVFGRKKDARTAFMTENKEERMGILKKYRVRYVVWGELERVQYGEKSRTLLERDLTLAAKFGFEPSDDAEHRVEIFEVK